MALCSIIEVILLRLTVPRIELLHCAPLMQAVGITTPKISHRSTKYWKIFPLTRYRSSVWRETVFAALSRVQLQGRILSQRGVALPSKWKSPWAATYQGSNAGKLSWNLMSLPRWGCRTAHQLFSAPNHCNLELDVKGVRISFRPPVCASRLTQSPHVKMFWDDSSVNIWRAFWTFHPGTYVKQRGWLTRDNAG